ncbi:MAG: translation initiation factor [Patescibacteria group bacterium]|nr:translation initiation factor [Patescibacteria group bacterium]
MVNGAPFIPLPTTLAIPSVRINNQIRGTELRIIGPKGENLGVMSVAEALKIAKENSLDLIEISPKAVPPVAKIADYGKFQYDENKKQKVAKANAKTYEVKSLQVKIGTGEHDLILKAKKASEWLGEGHRIKMDLFLPGRTKYLDENFLKDRMERLLRLVSVDFKIAEPAKKSPKGMTVVIEKK